MCFMACESGAAYTGAGRLARGIHDQLRASKTPGRLRQPDDKPSPLVLCRSAGRRIKEIAMISIAKERFIKDSGRLRDRIAKGRLKRVCRIGGAIDKLLKKHPRVARFYPLTHEPRLPASRRVAWNDANWSGWGFGNPAPAAASRPCLIADSQSDPHLHVPHAPQHSAHPRPQRASAERRPCAAPRTAPGPTRTPRSQNHLLPITAPSVNRSAAETDRLTDPNSVVKYLIRCNSIAAITMSGNTVPLSLAANASSVLRPGLTLSLSTSGVQGLDMKSPI